MALRFVLFNCVVLISLASCEWGKGNSQRQMETETKIKVAFSETHNPADLEIKFKKHRDNFCSKYRDKCEGSVCGGCAGGCLIALNEFWQKWTSGPQVSVGTTPPQVAVEFQAMAIELCTEDNKKNGAECEIEMLKEISSRIKPFFKKYSDEGEVCGQM